MRHEQLVALLGLGVLFVIAAGLTVAAYFSFIIPEYRGEAFYAAIVASCIAELVFLGYIGYTVAARAAPDQPDPAVRLRLMMLIGLWTLLILVTGGIAAAPGNADTFFSDHIILLQLITSFFGFAAVFFQHWQATVVQQREASPQQERRQLESYTGGLAGLLDNLRTLVDRKPEEAVALDALIKRVSTLKTQLGSVSAMKPRAAGRPVEPTDIVLIQEQLRLLHSEVADLTSTDDAHFAQQLQKTQLAVERALTMLRQREDALTF